MLRLSKLTDYGTVILGRIAAEHGGVHAAAEIAQATGIAPPTVSKLLKLLAKAEIVVSVRGAKGGYRLSRSADRISVAEVICALEGPIALTECSISDDNCRQSSICDIRGNWTVINKAIKTALESVSLADLIVPVAYTSVKFTVPVDSIHRQQRQ